MVVALKCFSMFALTLVTNHSWAREMQQHLNSKILDKIIDHLNFWSIRIGLSAWCSLNEALHTLKSNKRVEQFARIYIIHVTMLFSVISCIHQFVMCNLNFDEFINESKQRFSAMNLNNMSADGEQESRNSKVWIMCILSMDALNWTNVYVSVFFICGNCHI